MINNKFAAVGSLIASILALSFSVWLHFTGCEYVSNLFAGIFASGILALFIALINYFTERRHTLEKFFSYGLKVAANFNQFENDGDLERTVDSVLLMNQFDYLELDNAYGDMCFLFKNKKNKHYIFEEIYEPILKLRNLIHDISYHFKNYKRNVNGNRRVIQLLINDIDEFIMERTEEKVSSDDDSEITISDCKNRIVEKLLKELTGRYYEIMYPWKKEETKNAH